MRQLLLLTNLCVCLWVAQFAFAATYYIAPDKDLDGSDSDIVGDDANPGTLAQPWKTFEWALNGKTNQTKVNKGDTL
ncbi:MAG: hypothetical protein HYY57_05735, partial [Candidatus Omnitrophica bacterium]|nr:hypothetical protein [Candidatus Omnitrophota bacterium]